MNKKIQKIGAAAGLAFSLTAAGCGDHDDHGNHGHDHHHNHTHNHGGHSGHTHDVSVFPEASEAEFRAPVSRHHEALIDLDLLGPNGEITVGFIASLSPVPCNVLWIKGLDRESTDEKDVNTALRHLLSHGVDSGKVHDILDKAQQEWRKRSGVAVQHPAPGH